MPRSNSSTRITRRNALRLVSAPIVTLGLSHFVRAADKAPGFTFIAVNDLHYFDEECAPFFRRVVTQMRASAPEAAFCLIAGDVSDGGEAALHEFALEGGEAGDLGEATEVFARGPDLPGLPASDCGTGNAHELTELLRREPVAVRHATVAIGCQPAAWGHGERRWSQASWHVVRLLSSALNNLKRGNAVDIGL